jgi:phosphatidate phosphatase APP1
MPTRARRLRLAALGLLALAAPAAAGAGGSVVLIPSLARPTQVVVTGRVLDAAPEAHPGASALERNARRLAAPDREDAEVEVTFAGQLRRVRSGEGGFFEAAFAAPAHRPFPTGWQPVRAASGPDAATGGVQVVDDGAPFLLVTDFDDTLAVTNVESARATLGAALLQDADTQPVVPGMAGFYRCLLAAGPGPAPGGLVVSGSPVDFAARVEAFLARHGFPPLALALRRLGPRTLSGYKEPVLRGLISRFPQPVVLVGDSGERDPEIYAALRAEFPGRVAAVFIREAGGPHGPGRFEGMTLFGAAADAAREAAARGLADPACVAREFPPPRAAPAGAAPAVAAPPAPGGSPGR